jgi:hypothetical protein
MFIAKKHISRRTFLRGSGVTLALPLLDASMRALQEMATFGEASISGPA